MIVLRFQLHPAGRELFHSWGFRSPYSRRRWTRRGLPRRARAARRPCRAARRRQGAGCGGQVPGRGRSRRGYNRGARRRSVRQAAFGAGRGRMLRALSGRTHSVYTGVVRGPHGAVSTACADVTFLAADRRADRRVYRNGRTFDKAGGYRVQGPAREFIRALRRLFLHRGLAHGEDGGVCGRRARFKRCAAVFEQDTVPPHQCPRPARPPPSTLPGVFRRAIIFFVF